ncbi:TetR/AcrR family transcriptional regulator [Pseudosporangium ferrugineum]|uniref:TetR family transcriptional regulator n=1 Tax=Pseudosporangium ferrugineum TaxID=439699 RepID=A0A2T0SBG1_9ACTN|nr:TetR/AcrR family transcriptional regulator [Pseudosporangium ferrugineum]PRY30765.1 TetR family transcriptional regulator [Pseudosporangium ferrugineum]
MTRPLRRDAERNRQRILEAAHEVFAARGLDVTLDDIAHHADVAVGTVYRRFPSREHLVEALFETGLDQIAGWAREALDEPDPWTGLTGFLDRALEMMATDRGVQDVLFSRAYGHDRVAQARDRMAPLMDALVTRCQEAGVVRKDVAGGDLALIQFMLGAVIEYTQQTEPGLWRRYLTLFLDGLRTPSTPLPVGFPDAGKQIEIASRWKPPRRQVTRD